MALALKPVVNYLNQMCQPKVDTNSNLRKNKHEIAKLFDSTLSKDSVTTF